MTDSETVALRERQHAMLIELVEKEMLRIQRDAEGLSRNAQRMLDLADLNFTLKRIRAEFSFIK